MRLIRQRTELDCGIAAAAMLAGVSYDAAAAHDPVPYSDQGLSVSEFSLVVKRLTRKSPFVSRSGYLMPLAEAWDNGLLSFGQPIALVIRPSDGRRHGHWIAMHEGVVYDPERTKKIDIERYDLRTKWRLIRTARMP